MATSAPYNIIDQEAAGDLSANQYRFVVKDASTNNQWTAAGANALAPAVQRNAPDAAGRVLELQVAGVAKVEAGASITVGDYIATDSSARAVTAPGSGNPRIGIALEAAGGAGELIPVLLGYFGTT